MRDDPSGAALLDIAHRTLMAELAPKLAGRERYLALMVGNAVSIVARELAGADRTRALGARVEAAAASHIHAPDFLAPGRPAGLVAAIRAAWLDGDAGLHEALRQAAVAAVGISRPGFLSAAERDLLAGATPGSGAAG